jgi:hypothetical protein
MLAEPGEPDWNQSADRRKAKLKGRVRVSDNKEVCLLSKSFAYSYLAMLFGVMNGHLQVIRKVSADSKGL